MNDSLNAQAVRRFLSRYRRVLEQEPLHFRDGPLGVKTIYRDVERWNTTYCFPADSHLIRQYENESYTLIEPRQNYFIVQHDLTTDQIVKCGGEIKIDGRCIPMVFHALDRLVRSIPYEQVTHLTQADRLALGINTPQAMPLQLKNKYQALRGANL